jgi:Ulp1 family protease
MFRAKAVAAKYSGALAISLALFSAGFVMVHACHADQSSHGSVSSHHQADEAASTIFTSDNSLVAKVCSATFFFVLIFGRKVKLKKINRLRLELVSQSTFRVASLRSPPNLKYALSISQLGVIRI